MMNELVVTKNQMRRNKKKEKKKEKKMKEKREKRLKEKKAKETSNISMKDRKLEKSIKRIYKEYISIVKDYIIGADIIMINNNTTQYNIRFTPKDGHYKDQTMILLLNTKHPSHDQSYPYMPPLVKMLTPVWHVNISNSGIICVDFLTTLNKWNPSYGFGAIIIAIQLLFEEPNPASPYNGKAASLFKISKENNDFTEFDSIAKNYYNNKIKSGGKKILDNFDIEYKIQHSDRPSVGI